jgi:hypothetical protein
VPNAQVSFYTATRQDVIPILSVSMADAHAYEVRSGRRITADVLAAYWSDLFTDFRSAALGDPPRRLRALHAGDSLVLLGQALARAKAAGDGIGDVTPVLPASVQHHLARLAVAVPADYDRPRQTPAPASEGP